MNSATKNILTASLRVYEADKDKEVNILWVERQKQKLSDSGWINVRNSSDANHYQAYKIFLRIKKPKTKMSYSENQLEQVLGGYASDKTDKTDKKEVNHSERAHALLSASGASRWINCTPSPRLEEGFANESSSFAEEGTLAHEFAELNLRAALNEMTLFDWQDFQAALKVSEYYSSEMEDFVQVHIDYVLEQFTEAKRKTPDAILLIEQKVDITHLIEEGFGTCDVIIIADGTLEVIDLKYGLGVRVSADDNSQLKLYGSGALEAYDLMYDIHTVKLTITQPRMDSISSWEISAEDLRQWGEEVVKPKAQIAYAGEGEQVTGEWCKFCKASPRCKAQAAKAQELAQYDFADPFLLEDYQLVNIYEKIPQVTKWLSAVTDYIFKEAMNGKKWEGYKLVDGQNRRGWTDESEVATILFANDFEEHQFSNSKIKGIGDIEKLVGKKEFPALLGDVVAFKKTSPSLVPESDKRPALGIDQAKADFADDL
jgi:hypothetical protein